MLIALFFGIDPRTIQQGNLQANVPEPVPSARQAGVRDEGREFIARVRGSTEHSWGEIFRQGGKQYIELKLVLFSGQAQSARGFAHAAAGPFYGSNDQKVYIDLAFYRVPESFTHGSAARRARWFRAGTQSGDLKQCDTFASRAVS